MNDRVVCPECRGIMKDLWDHHWGSSDDIETNCGHCGADVMLSRHVTVRYSIARVAKRAPALPKGEDNG